VSGFLNFDEKIIATTIKLAHAKVSLMLNFAILLLLLQWHNAFEVKIIER
jgi:hypothetical protein